MKDSIRKISFNNTSKKGWEFEVLTLQNLYAKNLDHLLTNPQQIGFYLILLITRGQSFHNVDFRKYSLQKACVFTIGKNQIQQFSADKNNDGLIVLFTENFIIKNFDKKETFQRLLLFNDALLRPKFELSKQEFEDIHQLITSMQAEYLTGKDDQFKEGIIKSGLYILLSKLERYKQISSLPISTKHYIDDFLKFNKLLEKNLFQTKSVNDYAQKLNFSTKKLNYVTQAIINKPAKEFINDTFILEIKRLLINSNESIKEIAYKCGFDEPTNFVKYFKKYTRQLPTEFRQSFL